VTAPATSDATDTTGVTDAGEAALQFAKCMREHGIDMPDPQVSDEGGVMVAVGGPGQDGAEAPDPKDFEAGEQGVPSTSCKTSSPGFDPPSEEDQKKMQEQALRLRQVHARSRYRYARPAVRRRRRNVQHLARRTDRGSQ
jgi:hypothetical protein